jgi:DNA-binding MarR family transcriptional regulator
MIERRRDPADRRIVLVDYAPGMQDIARRMMESRSGKLREALDRMTDEEVRALLKGLRLLIESFELSQEGTHEPHR